MEAETALRKKKKNLISKLSVTQLILFSFSTVILIGTLLLCMPFSSASGEWTGFLTALFTATSATCVTGLTVVTTATYFSTAGQILILCLIQVGGLGIMTIISVFSVMFTRTVSIRTRNIAMQATGAINYNEIKSLLLRIFIGTILMELIGAAVLSIRFVPMYGVNEGLKQSVFTSVSAFCNAGFDIFGTTSLIGFNEDPLVMLTVAGLVILGGIGYIVWFDFTRHRFKLKRYSLHSKIALSFSGVLLLAGTGLFLFTEYNAAFAPFGFPEKVLNAFFQSVTMRTAGFCGVDQATLSDKGVLSAFFFMIIGGTSGSTAGGLKTTTFAVLVFTFISNLKNDENVVAFKRRIPPSIVKASFAIITSYVAMLFVSTIVILSIESGAPNVNLQNVVFEEISAIATVGLTRGITADLAIASKLIIILLMFVGRVGGFTFMLAFSNPKARKPTMRPKENILIG